MDYKSIQAIGGIPGIVGGSMLGSYIAKKILLKRRPDFETIKPQLEEMSRLRTDINKMKSHAGKLVTKDEIYGYFKTLPDDVRNKMTIDDYEKMSIDLIKHKVAPLKKTAGENDGILKNLSIGLGKGTAVGTTLGGVYSGVAIMSDKYKHYTDSALKKYNDMHSGYTKLLNGKPDKNSLYSLTEDFFTHSEPLKNPAKLFPKICIATRISANDYFKKHGVNPGKLSVEDYYTILKGIDRYVGNKFHDINRLSSVHPISLIAEQKDYENNLTNPISKGISLYGEHYPDDKKIMSVLNYTEDAIENEKRNG